MAVAEAGGGSGSAYNHAGRLIARGTTKVSVLGRGIRRPGLKLQVADGQRDPGDVQVDE